MTHGHNPSHGQNHPPKGPWYTQIHRDWRFIVAVVLMIAGLLLYIFSVDLSLTPAGPKLPTPAAP